MTSRELPPVSFYDPARGSRNLIAVHESFIKSGSNYPLEDFTAQLVAQLQASPDPDLALTNLLRFSETTVSKASLFNDLIHYPVVMDVLMKLFGFSRYFADILVREPGLLRWLTTSDALMTPVSKKYLLAELRRIEETFAKPERRVDALKRLYRREILRIGAQDILGQANLESVTIQLSDLADAIVDGTCRAALEMMKGQYGVIPATPFSVIGLGKLGGGELNYSSDIDLLFVYGDEGPESGERNPVTGGLFTWHEFFNKLSEKFVQLLSQPNAEGYLYRVDVRLRPESGAGPLARSLRSYLTYYESRGELWERQMLLKARPVGGDIELGEKFTHQLEPFVHPRTFFRHPAESIARIKARIEASVGDEANIKLMAGGIRDIEFIVQTLQLLNGGKKQSVRDVNTLRALQALAKENLLSDEEARTLAEAYRFYRILEHRLQTMLNTQTHTIPGESRTLSNLSKRMSFSTPEEFGEAWRGQLRAVRSIYDRVLVAGDPKGATGKGINSLLDGGLPDGVISQVLAGLRFTDTQRASRNLKMLMYGSSLTDTREFDAAVREAFVQIAPVLFDDIARSPDPDLTLNGFTAIAGAQKFPEQFYRQVQDSPSRKFILDICGMSPRFARGLAGNPLFMETMLSNVHSLATGNHLELPAAADTIEFKNQQELRAGIRYVLGFSSYAELTGEITRIADVTVRTLFDEEARKAKLKGPPLALFSLGKYGTGEITFDSDLDLLMISEGRPKVEMNRLETFASALVQRLTAISAKGKLYDIDVRLRPEGKNSPLVTEKGTYQRYLRERASLWERQSLTRLRFVSGDEHLAEQVKAGVESFVYATPLPPGWVETIVAMRRKMETRSRTRGEEPLDIKLGPGGMVDIEFLAQMVQLASGARQPDVRGKPVQEILKLTDASYVSRDEATNLAATYSLYRRLETLQRITLEERGTILPDGRKLETLSSCFDRSTGSALRQHVAAAMKETRRMFLEIAGRFARIHGVTQKPTAPGVS